MVFKNLFGSLAWPGTKKIAKKYLKIASIVNLVGKMLKFSNKSVFKSEQWAYINYNLFNFKSWSTSEHFTGLKKGLETIFCCFLGLKYLNSLMRIRDPGWRQFGSGILDRKKSDPGSGINIPDPPHCSIVVQ